MRIFQYLDTIFMCSRSSSLTMQFIYTKNQELLFIKNQGLRAFQLKNFLKKSCIWIRVLHSEKSIFKDKKHGNVELISFIQRLRLPLYLLYSLLCKKNLILKRLSLNMESFSKNKKKSEFLINNKNIFDSLKFFTNIKIHSNSMMKFFKS